jgi:hypothetical protein
VAQNRSFGAARSGPGNRSEALPPGGTVRAIENRWPDRGVI